MLVQFFSCARPKIELHLVPLHFFCAGTKHGFTISMQIIFWSGRKTLAPAQYVNQFLVWHKNLGPAQTVWRPVKGQGSKQDLYRYWRYRDYDRFFIPEGLLVIDCLFLFLFSFLNP